MDSFEVSDDVWKLKLKRSKYKRKLRRLETYIDSHPQQKRIRLSSGTRLLKKLYGDHIAKSFYAHLLDVKYCVRRYDNTKNIFKEILIIIYTDEMTIKLEFHGNLDDGLHRVEMQCTNLLESHDTMRIRHFPKEPGNLKKVQKLIRRNITYNAEFWTNVLLSFLNGPDFELLCLHESDASDNYDASLFSVDQ